LKPPKLGFYFKKKLKNSLPPRKKKNGKKKKGRLFLKKNLGFIFKKKTFLKTVFPPPILPPILVIFSPQNVWFFEFFSRF